MMEEYFDIKEVVCPHVYDRFGESAWRLFDPRIKEVMTWLRKKINRRIIINSSSLGLTQRGFRCNLCSLVKDKTYMGKLYVSPHMLAAGFDFDVAGMNAEEVRQWLEQNKEEIPFPVRLEQDISWVHLDVLSPSKEKIVYFPKT